MKIINMPNTIGRLIRSGSALADYWGAAEPEAEEDDDPTDYLD
jgi:hypothetical protein